MYTVINVCIIQLCQSAFYTSLKYTSLFPLTCHANKVEAKHRYLYEFAYLFLHPDSHTGE